MEFLTFLKAVVWLFGLLCSIGFMRAVSHYNSFCRMFPGGWRWYNFPLELMSYALFALLIHIQPF